MEAPPGAPEWLEVHTAAERPDLWESAEAQQLAERVWPEYNRHGNHTDSYLSILFPRHASLQALFVDRRSRRLVGRDLTIPFSWDGTLGDLPRGRDGVGRRALDGSKPPTALSALAAEVDPDFQGYGLSRYLISTMVSLARAAGLAPLVAPVRPTLKDRYPLISIERYAAWRREDGLPFDPWIRVHARLGGRILRSEPRSLEISAPVRDWEAWTGMRLPEDGDYVIPGGLAPVAIRGGIGDYCEPNVWMLHEVATGNE